MKVFQIKFRIEAPRLAGVLERLGDVGPVVVEGVDETPTKDSIRGAIIKIGKDMQAIAPAWEENTVDHSIPTTRRLYGLGKQILLDRLKDGPVPFHALADTYVNAGLKKSGLGSALGKLLVARLVERDEKPGFWKLKGN